MTVSLPSDKVMLIGLMPRIKEKNSGACDIDRDTQVCPIIFIANDHVDDDPDEYIGNPRK